MMGSLNRTLASMCKTTTRAKEMLRLENGSLLAEVKALFEVITSLASGFGKLFEVEGILVRAKTSVKIRTTAVEMPAHRLKIIIG